MDVEKLKEGIFLKEKMDAIDLCIQDMASELLSIDTILQDLPVDVAERLKGHIVSCLKYESTIVGQQIHLL